MPKLTKTDFKKIHELAKQIHKEKKSKTGKSRYSDAVAKAFKQLKSKGEIGK